MRRARQTTRLQCGSGRMRIGWTHGIRVIRSAHVGSGIERSNSHARHDPAGNAAKCL
jgi:hypothetical protein